MTDKQINIDGCDVSGCMYHRMNNKMAMCKACNSGVGSPYCEYHKDCYYKQLKRAEQKLEKIKQFRHDYCMNCEDLLKSSHSCKSCNMVELKHLIEE